LTLPNSEAAAALEATQEIFKGIEAKITLMTRSRALSKVHYIVSHWATKFYFRIHGDKIYR
jgi:hypothetical protein